MTHGYLTRRGETSRVQILKQGLGVSDNIKITSEGLREERQ